MTSLVTHDGILKVAELKTESGRNRRNMREKISCIHSSSGWRRRPPVASNILSKQSRTADKVWSSSLGVGQMANNS